MSEEQGRSNLSSATATASITAAQIEQLFREHYAMVFRAAYRVTGNAAEAEDVLQTVFLRLLRRLPDAEAVEHPESYLRRAAVNAAVDVVRARVHASPVPLEDLEPVLVSPSGSADRMLKAGEIRDWLRQTVARLSPRAAEIFALRFYEGLTNPEIARLLGTTEASVAVTVSRSRDRISKEYQALTGGSHDPRE